MDGDRTTENTRLALRRIVAMLLALAGLAKRADAAPLIVRWLVLLALRPAERRARNFTCDLAWDHGFGLHLPAPVFFDDGEHSVDAARLAARFLVLAEALEELCEHAGDAGAIRWEFPVGLAIRALEIPESLLAVRNLSHPAVLAHDTS